MKKILLTLSFAALSLFANPKVLMVGTSHDKLGDQEAKTGVWLSEFVHAYNEFKNAGFDIVVAAPKAGKLPLDAGSIKDADEESAKFLKTADGKKILDNAIALKDAKKSDFDALYLTGGHGTMWDFKGDKDLQEILIKMAKNQKIISGVCHGPAGLVDVKDGGKSIISGVKITAFSNKEESAIKLDKVVPFSLQTSLEKDGAKYSSGKMWGEHVVIDKNFVTGQNPASAKGVAKGVIKLLKK